jgi:hypothetical protein
LFRRARVAVTIAKHGAFVDLVFFVEVNFDGDGAVDMSDERSRTARATDYVDGRYRFVV